MKLQLTRSSLCGLAQNTVTFNPFISLPIIVSCSHYTQQCMGGFPYLALKFVQEFSVAEDRCFPYEAGIVADMTDPLLQVHCTLLSHTLIHPYTHTLIHPYTHTPIHSYLHCCSPCATSHVTSQSATTALSTPIMSEATSEIARRPLCYTLSSSKVRSSSSSSSSISSSSSSSSSSSLS
jgi:hypothetical protein